jgi:hypothetical protein
MLTFPKQCSCSHMCVVVPTRIPNAGQIHIRHSRVPATDIKDSHWIISIWNWKRFKCSSLNTWPLMLWQSIWYNSTIWPNKTLQTEVVDRQNLTFQAVNEWSRLRRLDEWIRWSQDNQFNDHGWSKQMVGIARSSTFQTGWIRNYLLSILWKIII